MYRNELDKTCFQHSMDYGDFTDLAKETASDNILRDKAFNIGKMVKYGNILNGNMMDIKEALLLWFTISLIKKQN